MFTPTQLQALCAASLFAGLDATQLQKLLPTLGCTLRQHAASEMLLLAGYPTSDIGVLLDGRLEAVKESRGGAQFTVARLLPGDVFGDVLAGSHTLSPVTVYAVSPSTVLRLPLAAMLGAPPPSCAEPARLLLANLVAVIADKYFALDARIELLLQPTLRKKISAWLLAQAGRAGSDSFTTSHTRASLARFLGCERSALSRELSRMSAEGLLYTRRASFTLLQPDKLRALL